MAKKKAEQTEEERRAGDQDAALEKAFVITV